MLDEYDFSFIPTGYNLNFEHNFLKERSVFHGLQEVDILNKAFIDLRSFGIIMNHGEFKNSGLDKITGKPQSGKDIPEWYANKDYGRIVDYIQVEAQEFIKLCQWLYIEMPKSLARFKTENNFEVSKTSRDVLKEHTDVKDK